MDPAIIAAIIEGVAIIAGGIFVAILNNRKNQQVHRAESAARAIHDLIRDRWGFTEKIAKTKVTIKNPDGLTYIRAERRGAKAQNVQLLHIPGKVSTDHPQGTIVQEPRIISKSPSNPRDIELHVRDVGKTRQTCEFSIDIMGGGLSPNEGEIDYEYEIAFSKMFSMTREELEELSKEKIFKAEYYFHDVTFPTDTIEAEIEFPEGYQVETYFAVFAGATEFINAVELKDKKNCFTRTQRGGYFKIENPLVGFRYVIYWMPPSKEDFEKFKQEFGENGASNGDKLSGLR
ncbi:MAG: hypothetical protein PVJ61_01020 [Dehalococcoidia bacterium]|jgi:hypothetical protein